MAIEVLPAEAPSDLMQAFSLRSKVFHGEGILACGVGDEPLIDVFDTLGTSRTFIARLDDGSVIGTLRATRHSPQGFPADQYFDFTPFLPDAGETAVSYSMLCVDPAHRSVQLAMGLLRMGFYWGIFHGAEHFIAPVRPEAAPLVTRLGARAVADTFDHPVEGVPVVPMVIDVGDEDPFLATVRKLGAHDLIEDFRRRSYKRNEPVLAEGDDGEEAFVIVDGQAEVSVGDQTVGELSPGDLFGEVALLLGGTRGASVKATTNLDVMVLSREAFERQIVAHPERARALMRSLGARLQGLQQTPYRANTVQETP